MKQEIFVSLYDYLGGAAGPELGKKVFEYSKLQKVKSITRLVNQGGYSGKVMCYPPQFLDSYFKSKEHWTVNKKYFG